MGPARVDIVGHFGTTYSYATVASEVAKALREADLLGTVSNLDDGWHDAHLHLKRGGSQGTHVIVFSAPNHYVDAFVTQYGRDRAALYVSPNTDLFAPEHSETCAKFGHAIAPSEWCRDVVSRGMSESADRGERPLANARQTHVSVLPLGVASAYASRSDFAHRCLEDLKSEPKPCRVLHVSTDQCWPGRKGTEELFEAWAILARQDLLQGAELIAHVPNALAIPAAYRARDLEIDESVTVERATVKGSGDDELLALFKRADLVVAPSRCEGFGMMLLASLVAGIPLVATYNTGQADFMRGHSGWLGVPTATVDELVHEIGDAPVVDAEVLARVLRLALLPETRRALIEDPLNTTVRDWAWPSVLPKWVGWVHEWIAEMETT